MPSRVAIVGIGYTPIRPASPSQSFKEMMFEAARRAYADAGIDFREVGSFVTCAEDLNESLLIFDEYTPDQLGAVLKPMHTLPQDGLHGIADGVMQILAGLTDLVVVEAHSKASNIVTPDWVVDYALDPVWNRPLGMNPHVIAALEMNAFLNEAAFSKDTCGDVVAKNKTNALGNPVAAYPANIDGRAVDESPYRFYPLRELDIARNADGCAVVVLASEGRARKIAHAPIWIDGVGFANGSPTLESRDWVRADYVTTAARMAYRQAKITRPSKELDILEIDDTYSYKELQHLLALELLGDNEAPSQDIPINISGGAIGMGYTLEATGLYRIVELVLQLRGQAGARQVKNAKRGLAQSWRGVPTTSSAVVVLRAD